MNAMQNLITLTLTDAQLAAVDAALTELETHLGGLISLTAVQKQQAAKMGEKSESFCRQTLTVLGQNRHVLPASMTIDDALADLRAREQLRPLLVRLTQLQQRAADSDLALGSDVMTMALYGYRALKVHGRGAGLENLQRDLGSRFSKTRRTPKATTPEAPTG